VTIEKDLSGLMQAVTNSPGMGSLQVSELMGCTRRTANKYLQKLLNQGLLFKQREYKNDRYFEIEYAKANDIPEHIIAKGKTSRWYRAKNGANTNKSPVNEDSILIDMLSLNKLWPATVTVYSAHP